jgi:very-short-patch-repair endonuclease
MPDKRDRSGRDGLIAGIAGNQHGVVTRAQLVERGVSTSSISDRIAVRRLHRIHRGVYAVGHPTLSEKGRWMAAVLACGENAALSHTSAAELWGIRRRVRRLSEAGGDAGLGPVHVSVPSTAGKRKRRGIVLHRSTTLMARHCTRRDVIPVTNPARTLADLRPLLSPAQFTAALREAEFLRLPIGDQHESGGARTELEDHMLALCRRHRLPKPEVNVRVSRYEVDFLWREQRLIIEVDGWDAHRTRSAFEEDRARDAHLALLGYEVVRFTWRRLTRDQSAVAKTIRGLLRTRAA